MNDEINEVYLSIQEESDPHPLVRGTVVYQPEGIYYEGSQTLTEGNYHFVIGQPVATYQMIFGTDKTLWKQLERVIKQLPDGPYHMDSRDGGIVIHNHKFGQDPYLTYSYNGGEGELISMDIKTQKKEKNVQITKSSNIDPDDKVVSTTITQSLVDSETSASWIRDEGKVKEEVALNTLWALPGYGGEEKKSEEQLVNERISRIVDSAQDFKTTKDNIRSSYEVTQEDVNEYFKLIKEQFDSHLSSAKNGDVNPLLKSNSMRGMTIKKKVPVRQTVSPMDLVDPSNPNRVNPSPTKKDWDYSNHTGRWREGFNYLKNTPGIIILPPDGSTTNITDQRAIANQYRLWDKVNVVWEREIEIELDGQRIFSQASPQNIQDAIAANDLSDLTQKQIKATLKVIGRPGITSSTILNIRNLSQRYTGEWYTKKVKHTINRSGYLCSCELIRKSNPIVLSTTTSSINTPNLLADIHNVAKRAVESGKGNTDTAIKNKVVEKIKQEEGLKGKNVIVDLDQFNHDTGEIPIYNSSKPVNLSEERAKARNQ